LRVNTFSGPNAPHFRPVSRERSCESSNGFNDGRARRDPEVATIVGYNFLYDPVCPVAHIFAPKSHIVFPQEIN